MIDKADTRSRLRMQLETSVTMPAVPVVAGGFTAGSGMGLVGDHRATTRHSMRETVVSARWRRNIVPLHTMLGYLSVLSISSRTGPSISMGDI